MSVRAGVAVAVLAVLLVGTGPMAAVAGAGTGTGTGTGTAVAERESTPFALQQDEIDADEVRMDVALRPNGTAEWTLEFWVRLDDENRTEAFESLREDIRNDPDNYTQSFGDRMNETVATASDATGREMSADGFAVETARQSFAREYGVVRYTFRWHGFAAVDGDELRAGDAIEGFYLDDGTRLLVSWPDDYELTSISPDPDDRRDRAAIWRGGDTEFVSGEPRLVVTASGTVPGAGAGSNSAVFAAVALLAVAGLGAAGVWWYRNRSPPIGGSTAEESETDTGSDSDADAARAAETAQPSDVAEPEQSTGSTPPEPDPELLTNEEQVLRLLRENGGRMKQQAVVEELGWTDAKTSKVVTGLREEGKLESFRLGRENVLSLPEVDEGVGLEAGPGTGASNGGDDSA